MNDDQLLASVPDYMSVSTMLKATASEEDGERFLFFEASNEDVDHQNEVILQKALANSADYYLRHGNIDISHYTILGPRSGMANFLEYEIGRPVAVQVDGKRTFVKAQLYSGDSPMARNADMVWSSLTKQNPPATWYASVGGAVLSKSIKIDPETKEKVAVVDAVRWNNTALDRCPVNKTVASVSTVPIGTFAKALGGFVFGKALEASYATDAAMKTGGAALGMQSLDHGGEQPHSYYEFRNKLAEAIKSGVCAQNMPAMIEYSSNKFSLAPDEAAEWVDRFLSDLKSSLSKRSPK